MAITFKCPNPECRHPFKVKDELAGKRAACPKCKKVLTIPKPQPAPAAPAPNLEDLAAEALAEPKNVAAAPQTIDFPCPMCEAPVSLGIELAGKRAQCPHCRNIIKVPQPEKKDPANWRQTDNLPTAARRDIEPAPEGAWAPAQAKLVSREALEEAGALREDPRRALTMGQKIRYAVIAGVAVMVVAVGGLLAYSSWAHGKQDSLMVRALKAADEMKSKEAAAVLYRAGGEYALNGTKRDAATQARAHFDKARELLTSSPASPTRDLLLLDLALSELDLAGGATEIDDGRRLKAADVQKQLANTTSARHLTSASWARVHVIRHLARQLIARGEGQTAVGLAAQMAAKDNPSTEEVLPYEGSEILASVGLEFLRADDKAKAGAMLEQAMTRQPIGPSAVALSLALGKGEPKPTGGGTIDVDVLTIGKAEGLARQGNAAAARSAIPPAALTDVRLRALMGIATATDTPDAGALEDAVALGKEAVAARNISNGTAYRLVLLVSDAGRHDDATQLVPAIPDPGLRARAQADVLRSRLKTTTGKADPALAAAVDKAQLAAAGLAHEVLARHNQAHDSGTVREVESWDEALRPFGLAGVALGMQDRR